MPLLRRRRGAQPGNRNALKHGYYSPAMGKASRNAFRRAKGLDPQDLAEEIALCRARIFGLLDKEPENHNIIVDMLRTLTRMASVHHDLNPDQEREFAGALEQLVAELMPGLTP